MKGTVTKLEYAYGKCPLCKSEKYLRYLIHADGLTHKPHEVKCLNCYSYWTIQDIHGQGEETTPTPQTNADRIRSMSDEEIANHLAGVCPVVFDMGGWSLGSGKCAEYDECKDCWLDWLKKEATP